MDIWRWVEEAVQGLREAGRERLADLVERIPHLVGEDRHAEVDALVPEALALAREAGSPWLVLFLRHWHLQSRVLHRQEVAEALGEAVSLVEFAHREETRDCPQSVCATQDLTACYSAMDGPGWAPERLAATRETLRRVDPRWPCFVCISGEHAEALVDSGRLEEALSFLDLQASALRRAGGEEGDVERWVAHRAEALFGLGRTEEALAEIERAEPYLEQYPSLSRANANRKARALALLGRSEEGLPALVPFDEVLPTHSLHLTWTRAAAALCEAGAVPNDLDLDARLGRIHEALDVAGAARGAFEVEILRGRLAAGRGRWLSASFTAEDAARHAERLRRPESVRGDLDRLRRRIEAARLEMEDPVLPADPEALVRGLGRNPESDLELLEAARRRWPDAEDLPAWASAALSALGRRNRARALLEEFLAAHPDAVEVRIHLTEALLLDEEAGPARNLAEEALARGVSPRAAAALHWAVSRSHLMEGDLGRGREHLLEVLEADPDSVDARLVLAEVDRADGKVADALVWLDQAVALSEEPGDADWSRIIVGTLAGDWPRVRDSGRRLGLELEGEGPIQEDWGACRVLLAEDDGSRTEVQAVRTGPASALVVQVSPPGTPQHFYDQVVIDPRSEEEGEDEETPPLFEAVAYAASGFHTIAVESEDPGEEAVERLVERLEALDCAVEVYRGGEDGDSIGVLVAFPPDGDRARIEAVLAELPGKRS